ncbi:BUD13-like protein [Cryptotermes secundus]|uniref:BUD13 homolog n=1 Tax=Cryptotermes secundus TaxID=105785 RepID=A0A2J7RB97_9NEOP|nr:BUD13 homolog [Cryptotermes secundus]PNF38109.1 BUD13-like protein [Cryptotermes secundus]
MAVSQLSQKDYLKKYFSSNAEDKRKRKKKKLSKTTHERFRVVDDDIDLKNMRPLDEGELDLYHLSEDAPQIAGIIDERPEYMRTLEEFRGTRKWRIMSDENGAEDIKVTAVGNVDKQVVTGSLRNHGKSDLSPQRRCDSAKESKKASNKHPDSESSPMRKCQGDSDASPPRKSRIRSESDISPPRKLQMKGKNRKENDSDSSPPWKHKNGPAFSPKSSDSEVSPLRKEKSKRDLSPVRRSKGDTSLSAVRRSNCDMDLSPVRKSKHDSNLSPARKGKHEAGKPTSTQRSTKHGISSPRKNKYHSDSSPPRKSRKSEGYDETHLRNSRKHGGKTNRDQRRRSDSDTSPPRKIPRHYGSPSLQSRKDSSRASSSLKTSRNSDSSHHGTARKYEQHGSLPVRSKQGGFKESNKQNKDCSLVMESVSPSRHHNRSESPVSKGRHQSLPDSPPRKSGGRAHSENSFSDNSPQRISKRSRNSPKKSDSEGRGKVENKNVHQDRRDKMKGKMEKTLDGKKAGLQVAGELRQEISDFKRREDDLFALMGDEISGKGAVVVVRDRTTGKCRNLEEEAKQKQEQDEKMAQRKEKYAKWGKGLKQVEEQKENLQQALHEISKPLARYADDKDLEQHLRNQEREGDPMLEYIRSKKTEEKTKSKLKYQGTFLPNRFGIPPGHRWDGVDRSNGYERQWFERQSSRRAVEEEAYKWSTSDM